MIQPKSKKSFQRCTFLILAMLMLLPAGCRKKGADFTYGKLGDKSVNGLSVFAELLRQQGHAVSRKRRMTKRLEKFDTIVWAPDNANQPPEQVIAFSEQWLSGGQSRVLIYIGRSYDGKLPFYRSMVEHAPAKDRESWQRAMNETIIQSPLLDPFNFGSTDPGAAWWFEKDDDVKVDASKLAGPWATGVDSQAVELDCQVLLKPMEDYNDDDETPTLQYFGEEDSYNEYYDSWTFRDDDLVTKDLLTVDGKPFAFEVTPRGGGGGKMIVISNGSFLLNFPLTNPESRKLASKVADEVNGDVVFIESGYQWPKVGGEANDPKMQWSWVAQPPMNFIVPHFLFWGVLYCFVFYPNFGRPRRIQFHPPKAFRSHVKAVAAILGRSKEKGWARGVVNTWLARNNKTKS